MNTEKPVALTQSLPTNFFEYEKIMMPTYVPPRQLQLLSRQAVSHICPWLINLDEEKLSPELPSASNDIVVRGALVTVRQVSALIEDENPDKTVLILSLPKQFEPHLPMLVLQTPEVFCIETEDLLHSAAYAAWSCHQQSDLSGLFDLHVIELVLSDAYQENCPRVVDEDEPLNRNMIQGWFPTIILCSNSIAIGGQWIDESKMDELYAASFHSVNYKSRRFHSEEELLAASKEARDRAQDIIDFGDSSRGVKFWGDKPYVVVKMSDRRDLI